MGASKSVVFVSLLVGMAGISSPLAEAAYPQPVTWADLSALDLKPAFQSPYSSTQNLMDAKIPESALSLVLNDADQRINPDFRVPGPLRPAVNFWLRVYTEFTTQHVAIYDSRHPELVYEVLDFRPLAAKARNRVVYEILFRRKVEKTMAAYRKALIHLGRGRQVKNPTREEANVIAAVKKLPHFHRYSELRESLRAQTGQRDNIVKGLLAAEAFFPNMERIFTRMNVPLELTRLTLVESSFNLGARSKVGASGVWQFMPKSGKEFLTIDDRVEVDERLSPLKATVAAAKLLKRNFRILGSWALAITAFNHGPKGLPHLRGGQDFQKIVHLFDSCDKNSRKKHLGYASGNYYAEFLAVLHAEAYRSLFYGQAPKAVVQPVAFRRVPRGMSAFQVARQHGVSIQNFELYNPDVMNPHKKQKKGLWIAVPGETDDIAGLTQPKTSSRDI